jgi:hypothetical protein
MYNHLCWRKRWWLYSSILLSPYIISIW